MSQSRFGGSYPLTGTIQRTLPNVKSVSPSLVMGIDIFMFNLLVLQLDFVQNKKT